MVAPRSFEAVFFAYYAAIRDFVERYVRSQDTADDLTQDVFAEAWARWDATLWDLPSEQQKLYLYKAARNRALNYLEHLAVERRYAEQMLVEEGGERASSSGLLDGEDDTTELSTVIRAAVDALPERCRTIFLMSRRDALTYAQIAQLLGISVNTVKTQMGRALDALRAAIGPFLVALLVLNL